MFRKHLFQNAAEKLKTNQDPLSVQETGNQTEYSFARIIDKDTFYEFIVENSTDVIFQTTATGIITYMSPSLIDISGYTLEEVQGKRFTKFVLKREIPKFFEQINTMISGKKINSFEGTILNKNGEKVSVEFSGVAVKKDGQKYINGIMRDISDRKQTQKMLATINKKLEEKVKERTLELQDAYDMLKSINTQLELKVQERTAEIELILKQKDEFINQLGHDLKNPLGPILNLLPILENNEKNPRQKKLLEVIHRNVKYMKNLVIKTIQLAQLKSPNTKLECETFNLKDEVEEILETNKMLFEKKHITIKNQLPEDLMINADKLKIDEVLNNLLNNAVKYTEKDHEIISIEQKHSQNDEIIISVRDQGIGMTTEQLHQVFNEFYKADKSRHEFDSSGLGMPIVKRIIMMHGGHIWVESDGLGKGSTFYFSLPKKQVDE